LITSTDITHGKPHPEPYQKGAKLLGLKSAECVVIEDAPAGIRAGKAAGARVFCLRTTATDPELRESGADWIADDLASLHLDSVGPDNRLTFVLESRHGAKSSSPKV
jgi:mannitol-1-/sugar-/sorbitol-6-phosphatase